MKVTYELLDLDLVRVDDKVKDPSGAESMITRVTRQPYGDIINIQRRVEERDVPTGPMWTEYALEFRKETRDQWGNTYPPQDLDLTSETERLVHLRIAKATAAAAASAIENIARLAATLRV